MKSIIVCPKCYHIPIVNEGGYNVCPVHGICETLRVVQVHDPNAPDEDGNVKGSDAPVIGKCRAKVTSAGSSVRGKRCGRPARHIDSRNRPVCGYHYPTSQKPVKGRPPKRIRKKPAKRAKSAKRAKKSKRGKQGKQGKQGKRTASHSSK